MPAVLLDREGRLSLELRRTKAEVCFISTGVTGLAVQRLPPQAFDAHRKKMPKFEAKKVARLLVGYAADLGATEEALQEIGLLTQVSTAEHLAIQATMARGESDGDASRDRVRGRKR